MNLNPFFRLFSQLVKPGTVFLAPALVAVWLFQPFCSCVALGAEAEGSGAVQQILEKPAPGSALESEKLEKGGKEIPLQESAPKDIPASGSEASHEARPETRSEARLETRPVESELSSSAKETLAHLLFIQAIFDEDEAALLEAAPLLAKAGAAPGVWLDGAVWLMDRKSSNSPYFLEKALEAHPDNADLTLLRAEALGNHGMAGRGVELMRSFIARHPDSSDAKIELALLLVKDKQFDEAQKILSAIPAKQRGGLVNYYQAKALIGMDRSVEAIPWLRKAVKDLPNFAEALAELAFLYEKEGNFREARNCYEKLQKLHFSPKEVSLRLIGLSLKLRQPERAAQYFRQGPDNLQFKISAAQMFIESSHYLQAEKILKQIAESPDAPVEVFLLLADLARSQRDNMDMAMSWLDKTPDKNNGKQKAAVLRSQLLAEAGKMDEALELAQKNIQNYPDFPEASEFGVQLLARAKKLPEALALASDSSRKWPANANLSFILGSLQDESGQKKEAMATMEELLKKDPNNFQAMNYIGYTLAEESRDLSRALELLKRANELSPNQAYIVDSLAWAYYKAGEIENAIREIRRAASLDNSADSAIWEHYGDIAAQMKKKDEAKKAYRKALELKHADPEKIRKKLSAL